MILTGDTESTRSVKDNERAWPDDVKVADFTTLVTEVEPANGVQSTAVAG